MKKILSATGFGALAISLLFTSCVSKRKYTEAQSTIEHYRADSAKLAERSNTLQQSLTTLEQKNKSFQQQIDSSTNLTNRYQKRWENFKSYYDQQKSSADQLRQQITTALDGSGLSESNVQAKNGRIIVTLPEDILFTSGSMVNSKGKEALAKLANVLKTNNDYSVDVATTASYAAYAVNTESKPVSASTEVASDKDIMSKDIMSKDNKAVQKPSPDKDASTKDVTTKQDKKSDKDDLAKADPPLEVKAKTDQPVDANIGDSSVSKDQTIPSKADVTVKKHKTATKTISKKSKISNEQEIGTFETNSKGTGVGAKSRSSKMKGDYWTSEIARATSIVKILAQNGVSEVRLIASGAAQNQNSMDAKGSMSADRGYYVILSPKMDKMNQMIQEGNGNTGTSLR